ncbi:MAG: hypothetical protein ABS87_01760 [Sphingomonas sp. SCN 67-18]|uniref:HutD/Ves family protein n=1 Tax=uncultured Sphingomonas sp. TaxID=158754 RepID=UPI000869566C|nr:HutD family protein [Sphingomonas sp. SCN 67-18]ODU22518.1 MAG: hypothetical protein ABS87_01760 [Sphingomonas sp. SCN 67-18]
MRILRSADYPAMAWKNGGGETREIMLLPAGASLDDFDWRVSIARVDGDGPFSAFDGIDRTLTLLSGAMTLTDAAGEVARLDPASPPFAFDGGRAIAATVSDGPVLDLNVMTRRASHRHSVRRVPVRGDISLVGTAPVTLAVALENGLACAAASLLQYDGVLLERGETARLQGDGTERTILLIVIN